MSFTRWAVTVRLAGGLMLMAALMALPPAAAARAAIHFEITIGSDCLVGWGPEDIRRVEVSWRDTAGTLKAERSLRTNKYGGWELCLDEGQVLEIGDRIDVRAGTAERTYRVPELSLIVDRDRNVLRGRGPAGRIISVGWVPIFYDVGKEKNIRVGADGTWRFNPPGNVIDLITWLSYHPASGDHLYIDDLYAPQVTAFVDSSRFSGVTSALSHVELTVVEPSSGHRIASGEAVGDRYGRFQGNVQDLDGNPYLLRPGDEVRAPAIGRDAHFVLPNITGRAIAETDVVAGRCPDTGTAVRGAQVTVIRRHGHVRGQTGVGTDSTGRFRVDMSLVDDVFWVDRVNIKPGDKVEIRCFQESTDSAGLRFVVE